MQTFCVFQVETGFDTSDEVVRETRQVEMSMAPNPSHLEAVNSVVAGMVRSKQMRVDTGRAGRGRVSQRKVMGECPYASPFHTQIPNHHPITDQSLTNYLLNRFVDTRRRRVLRVGRERRGDAAAGPAGLHHGRDGSHRGQQPDRVHHRAEARAFVTAPERRGERLR